MDEVARPSDKEHWSNWHVTINFNTKGNHFSVNEYEEGLNVVLGEFHWKWLQIFINGTRRDFKRQERDLVNTIRARIGFERGPNNGFLHAHVLLEVGHYTMLQIDGKAIQRLVDTQLGVKSNVQFRWLKGDSSNKDYILRYITKTIREKPEPSEHQGANQRLVKSLQSYDADGEEQEYNV